MGDRVNKRLVKANEFRVLADAAAVSAAASELAHVREKFERACDVWTKLADDEERREEAAHLRLGQGKAAVASA